MLLVYLLRSRRSARSKAWVKVGYVLFVIAGIYAILRPDDTTVVANWLGVARGTDLMEYVLIIAFVFTTLSAPTCGSRTSSCSTRGWHVPWRLQSRAECPRSARRDCRK